MEEERGDGALFNERKAWRFAEKRERKREAIKGEKGLQIRS